MILFYTIYCRVFVVRMPKDLYLFNNFNHKTMFIIALGFFTSLLILYKSILIYTNTIKETKFTKLIARVHNFFEDIMKNTYSFCHQNNPKFYDNLVIFTDNFYKFFGYKHEGLLIVITNIIKCIILIAFLLDVFYFFKLKYFYFMLYFLIINMIINLIIFVLKDFAELLESIKSQLIITTTIDKEKDTYNIKMELNPENSDNLELDLHATINEYKVCNRISGYLEAYDFYQKDYIPRFNILIYSSYLVGWSFIIIKNIYIIYNILQIT